MNYTEFSQKIKAKYPQYADLDDLTLAKKMVAKYPQYSDVIFDTTAAPVQTAQPQGPGALKQLFTGEGEGTAARIGQTAGYTLGKLGEMVKDQPRKFISEGVKLVSGAEKIARYTSPGWALLAHTIPGFKKTLNEWEKRAVEAYEPSEETKQKLAQEPFGEKVARAGVDLLATMPFFMGAAKVGGKVAAEAVPEAARLAEKLGYKGLREAAPHIVRIYGKQAGPVLQHFFGNVVGFGALEGVKATGEGAPLAEVAQRAAGGAGMGTIGLGTGAVKGLAKPVVGAAMGAGLTALGGGGPEEMAQSAILFGVMEGFGMKPDKDPVKARAALKAEAERSKATDPNRAEDIESIRALIDNIGEMTPEQAEASVESFLTPQGKRAARSVVEKHKELTAAKAEAAKAQAEAEKARMEAVEAGIDQLSGLKTRKSFIEAQKPEHTQSVIWDIDKFKAVNDTYGHPVGDEVIREVSRRVKEVGDKYGADIGRVGGEEIAAAVPEGVDAARLAEEVRAAVEATPVKTMAGDLKITLSGGVARTVPGETPWADADKALYRAKQGGRNRVEVGGQKATKLTEPLPEGEIAGAKPTPVEAPSGKEGGGAGQIAEPTPLDAKKMRKEAEDLGVGACGAMAFSKIRDGYALMPVEHTEYGVHFVNEKNGKLYDFTVYENGEIPQNQLGKYRRTSGLYDIRPTDRTTDETNALALLKEMNYPAIDIIKKHIKETKKISPPAPPAKAPVDGQKPAPEPAKPLPGEEITGTKVETKPAPVEVAPGAVPAGTRGKAIKPATTFSGPGGKTMYRYETPDGKIAISPIEPEVVVPPPPSGVEGKGAERVGESLGGAKTFERIFNDAAEKQKIGDAIRKLGPERAFEQLRAEGYDITLDEMKRLGPQVMGGAGARREAAQLVNDAFARNFDKAATVEAAAAELQGKKDLTEITDRWVASNERELNAEVGDMMNAIKVNPEFIREFVEKQKPVNKADLTLHNTETKALLDEFKLSMSDISKMGNDGVDLLLKSAKLTETANRTAIAAKELMTRAHDMSLPESERAAYRVQAEQMMRATWNLAQKEVLTKRQIGRALQYMSQGKQVDANNVKQAILSAIKEPGVELTKDQTAELFKRVADLKPGQPLLPALRKMTFGDWFWHWYYASILSGPRTHFKNIGDTFANGLAEQLTNIVIDPMNAPGVIKDYTLGAGKGLWTAAKETGKAFALKEPSPEVIQAQTKFELPSGPVGNAAWKILSIPGRIMAAWDLGNQMPTKAAAVSSITRGRVPTEAELIQAAHESRRAAYNNEPEGWVGVIADRIAKTTNDVKPAKFIIPFTRIVANVLNSGMDYTPIGLKRAVDYRYDRPEWRRKQNLERFGTETSPFAVRDFRKQLARVAIGTTAMSLLYAFGKDRLTGGGPQDPNKKDQLRKTGWQEYSVLIDGKWVSYANLGSLSLPLAIVGNLTDAEKYRKMSDDELIDRTSYALMGVGRTMLDKSFLSGASDFIQAIERQDKKYVQRLASQPVTAVNPNFVKQVTDLFDPDARAPQTTAQRILRSFRPLGQEGIPERIDVFGKPVKRETLQRVSEFLGLSMVDAKAAEPVLEVLVKAGAFLPGVGKVTIKGEEQELKGDELVQYRKLRGQLVKQKLDARAQEIFAKADDRDALQDIARQITSEATKEAKAKYRRTNP